MASIFLRDDKELLAHVEALSDSFQAEAVEQYVRLFSRVIAEQLGLWSAQELEARYQRVRRKRRFEGDPERVRKVFVLSRVTLGADVAVTSVVLEAAKRRFAKSRIVLVGRRASAELFAADPRIDWLGLEYGRRASVGERLAAGLELARLLDEADSIVLDPDSRLSQLGLLPVADEQRYYFFESRCWGGDGPEPIAELTRQWAAETLGVPDARPWMAPAGQPVGPPGIAVSLGVGENPSKRLPDPFEEELLRGLAEFGLPLVVDLGPGGEEAARALKALERAGLPPGQASTFKGSFAQFALRIAASRLYVGYDSAGQHAAAALGTPLVTVFAGFPCERFFARWQPSGPGPKITVRVDEPTDVASALDRTLAAARELLAGSPKGAFQVSSSGTTRTNSPMT